MSITGLGGIGATKSKVIPKAVLNRISEINRLMPMVDKQDDFASTYAGSTMESYIELTKPIEVKGQYVYIHEMKRKWSNSYGFEKRYNTNKRDDWDDKGLVHLKYDLGIILKSYKQLLKIK